MNNIVKERSLAYCYQLKVTSFLVSIPWHDPVTRWINCRLRLLNEFRKRPYFLLKTFFSCTSVAKVIVLFISFRRDYIRCAVCTTRNGIGQLELRWRSHDDCSNLCRENLAAWHVQRLHNSCCFIAVLYCHAALTVWAPISTVTNGWTDMLKAYGDYWVAQQRSLELIFSTKVQCEQLMGLVWMLILKW